MAKVLPNVLIFRVMGENDVQKLPYSPILMKYAVIFAYDSKKKNIRSYVAF